MTIAPWMFASCSASHRPSGAGCTAGRRPTAWWQAWPRRRHRSRPCGRSSYRATRRCRRCSRAVAEVEWAHAGVRGAAPVRTVPASLSASRPRARAFGAQRPSSCGRGLPGVAHRRPDGLSARQQGSRCRLARAACKRPSPRGSARSAAPIPQVAAGAGVGNTTFEGWVPSALRRFRPLAVLRTCFAEMVLLPTRFFFASAMLDP